MRGVLFEPPIRGASFAKNFHRPSRVPVTEFWCAMRLQYVLSKKKRLFNYVCHFGVGEELGEGDGHLKPVVVHFGSGVFFGGGCERT